ncbi:MAG: hypothetical protein R6U11_11000 [Bacteroidales bacterium]
MKHIFFLIILFSCCFASCEKEVEFHFDLDDLIGTKWGVPDIIELAPDVINYDLSAPTVFYEDGHMTIGDSRTDFWTLRDSQSIHIEQMAEIWFVTELTSQKLHVEKSKYPSGKFLLSCIYTAIEDE